MNYRIRFHPLVARDLDAIAHWILDYAGPYAAARKLAEIEAAIATLKDKTMDEQFRTVYAEESVALEEQRREYADYLATFEEPA